MFINTIPNIKTPLVTLNKLENEGNNGMARVGSNTSQHDIPSNDLFDHSGNMVKVSNNQQTLSMMSSATIKGGADHTRQEHEDVIGEAELSDEPVQFLNELQENRKAANDSTLQHGPKDINMSLIPAGQQQKAEVNEAEISEMRNTVANERTDGSSISLITKFNLTPTNILHVLVTHNMDTLRALDNPRKDHGALVMSGYNQSDTFGMDMGRDFYEEGEEEELLDASFKNIARVRDLSPRHMRSGSNKNKKKTHERQHSWDGKVTQEIIINQL
ncbi:hypothetical protein A4A49_61817 [Nicotiana attenuata]|uniref:Uncharacterized protein n=1 Tax=Nicotiana attenuata TaxID=49451 RepID=A0A314KV38_NICAT|nr:hypothetical protein A4A49_61817 [Nicotiana attenuata]